ncbi:MAG: regulatory protein RecX [Clostridia bacterium]|nr:regulatory protein RecX [Clostridia bacterium]
MPRAMLRERPYKGGMPFDRQAFELFLKERSYPFALEKSVALLASRARTEKEIVDCLRKNAYPEAAIAKVMARLHEAGYINDADFAAQWTAARASKGLGSRRIRMELRQKGVDQTQIDQALSAMDDNDMMSGAIKAAQKAARGKDLSSPADRQKILAALARRGYDYALARQALQELLEIE